MKNNAPHWINIKIIGNYNNSKSKFFTIIRIKKNVTMLPLYIKVSNDRYKKRVNDKLMITAL